MKNFFLMTMLLLMAMIIPSAAKDRAKQVIAHRGYWKTEGSAQNSISSLKNTYRIGVYGSEFDVHITRDDEVVVFHDDDILLLAKDDKLGSALQDLGLKNRQRATKKK